MRAFLDPQRSVAVVAGALLTAVGVAGFLTTGSGLPLLGTGPLASGLYLLTGVLGLGIGLVGPSYVTGYNQTMAVLYAGLVLVQFRSPELLAGVADVGGAHSWFHLALAVAFGVVGFFAPMAGYRLRE